MNSQDILKSITESLGKASHGKLFIIKKILEDESLEIISNEMNSNELDLFKQFAFKKMATTLNKLWLNTNENIAFKNKFIRLLFLNSEHILEVSKHTYPFNCDKSIEKNIKQGYTIEMFRDDLYKEFCSNYDVNKHYHISTDKLYKIMRKYGLK